MEEIPVERRGEGSVWVTTYEGVVRLDARTAGLEGQTGRYESAFVEGGHGLVVADGHVWVVSPTTVDGHDFGDYHGAVVRVDPDTTSVDGEVRDEEDMPWQIVALDDDVWVAAGERLKLVDPNARRYERAIDLDRATSGLAAGHGALWTVDSSEGVMLRIDPDGGDVTAFNLGGQRPGLRVLAVGTDDVWVADDSSPIPSTRNTRACSSGWEAASTPSTSTWPRSTSPCLSSPIAGCAEWPARAAQNRNRSARRRISCVQSVSRARPPEGAHPL